MITLWTSAVYEDHVWKTLRVPVQRNLPLLCAAFYRVDADVLSVGPLHLIHYPLPAREIVESESIQKDQRRACCSTELCVN